MIKRDRHMAPRLQLRKYLPQGIFRKVSAHGRIHEAK